MNRIVERIYEIIEPAKGNDRASYIFDNVILAVIFLNILAVILESFEELGMGYGLFFRKFEVFSIIIFTIEYFLRILTARCKYNSTSLLRAIIRYIFSPMAFIDLLAILPFYLPLIIRIDLRFLRILRLTRLLRILKIGRYSKSLKMLGIVLKNKQEELIITLFVTFLLLLMAASIMYNLENEAQPEAFPNILASFWWAVATLTTVGYGDVYPVTILGKILSGVIALLGIGLVALPTGIISSGFMEEFNRNQKRKSQKYRKSAKNRYMMNKLKRNT